MATDSTTRDFVWFRATFVFGSGLNTTINDGHPVSLVPDTECGDAGPGTYSLMIERRCVARITGTLDSVREEADKILRRHVRTPEVVQGGAQCPA